MKGKVCFFFFISNGITKFGKIDGIRRVWRNFSHWLLSFPRDKDAWINVWKEYAWKVVSGARLLSKPFHDWELEVVTKLFLFFFILPHPHLFPSFLP